MLKVVLVWYNILITKPENLSLELIWIFPAISFINPEWSKIFENQDDIQFKDDRY